MEILEVDCESVGDVTEALVSAFTSDPLVDYLFARSTALRVSEVAEAFRVLLEVRIELGMPCFRAVESGITLGAVMGYDTSRPKWGAAFSERWHALMERVDGLEDRFNEYGELAKKSEPQVPHFYLGVIGVRDGKRGLGVGKQLLERFCERSSRDEKSEGVYLETASEASLRFYLRNGFELTGQGVLGRYTRLWCVFRPSEKH